MPIRNCDNGDNGSADNSVLRSNSGRKRRSSSGRGCRLGVGPHEPIQTFLKDFFQRRTLNARASHVGSNVWSRVHTMVMLERRADPNDGADVEVHQWSSGRSSGVSDGSGGGGDGGGGDGGAAATRTSGEDKTETTATAAAAGGREGSGGGGGRT